MGETVSGGAIAEQRAHVATQVSLDLLGSFALRCDDRDVRVPLSGQRVLALLALSNGPMPRLLVAGTLWAEVSDPRAAAALRTALWRITAPAGDIVSCDGNLLAIRSDVRIDLHEMTRSGGRLLHDQSPEDCEVAAMQSAGDLLPGWYEDWVLIERERFRQLRMHALERVCVRLTGLGEHGAAVQAGLAAVAADPLRESAHRVLVAAHLAEGNAGEALAQYSLCRELLGRHLGLPPSSAFDTLVAPLRHP